MAVNWSKPIEAIDSEGKVSVARVIRRDQDGTYVCIDGITNDVATDGGLWFNTEGKCVGWSPKWDWVPRIRNVQPAAAKPVISDELMERMVALLRKTVARLEPKGSYVTEEVEEARAIVAELPQPVDPDEEEAKRIAIQNPVGITGEILRSSNRKHCEALALTAIKRGRALERGEP